MSEQRPLLVGYVRGRPGEISPAQMWEMQGRLHRRAFSMGLEIKFMFVEKDSLSQRDFDNAFTKLTEHVGRRYLLIPASEHLDHIVHLGDKAVFAVIQDLTAHGIEVLSVP